MPAALIPPRRIPAAPIPPRRPSFPNKKGTTQDRVTEDKATQDRTIKGRHVQGSRGEETTLSGVKYQ